jgi:hypothetical protein
MPVNVAQSVYLTINILQAKNIENGIAKAFAQPAL